MTAKHRIKYEELHLLFFDNFLPTKLSANSQAAVTDFCEYLLQLFAEGRTIAVPPQNEIGKLILQFMNCFVFDDNNGGYMFRCNNVVLHGKTTIVGRGVKNT